MTLPRREHRRGASAGSLLTVLIALGLLAAAAFFLVALTGIFGIGLIVIFGLLFGFVAFHYFVWGKWLGPMIRDDVEADEAAAHSASDSPDDPSGPAP